MSQGVAFSVNVTMPVIDEEMEAAFRQAFSEVDNDGSGELDKKEFRQFITATGQDFGNKYIFQIVDADRSGKISIDEFLQFGRAVAGMALNGDFKQYLKLVFTSCDVGRKGALTCKEFLKFMKYIGQPVGFFNRKKVMKLYDGDGNGTIDFNEILGHLKLTPAK
jgi:Ca2+-binding EF-hand superfamily protein